MQKAIGFLGDIHGYISVINDINDKLGEEASKNFVLIQVGDFGLYNGILEGWKPPTFPVYVIDGNHEDHNLVRDLTEITEIKPNLFFVPRGTVLEIFGWKLGCCGGAESIDKFIRLRNAMHWSVWESVTQQDIDPLIDADVDMLVTHCPPASVIEKSFPRLRKHEWGLPPDWRDGSADMIELLWTMKGKIPLICGHMHKSVKCESVRILAEAELIFFPAKEIKQLPESSGSDTFINSISIE